MRRFSIVALLLILIAALFLRIYDITNRPLHNDEAVNFHFVNEIFQRGYYPYSHENYHGPSYFYLTTAFVGLFGDSELALRGSAIAAGVITVALAFFLLLPLGIELAAVSALLLAISPSLIFYSRYAIHETLFALAGLWFAFCVFHWWRTRQGKFIIQGLAAGAMLVATKETFIVTLFCIFLAFLSLGGFRSWWGTLKSQSEALFHGALIFVFLLVIIFTGGFQWAGGLREMLLAVPQWVGRNSSDNGHFKPFLYYSQMILETEGWLLLIPGLMLGWLVLAPKMFRQYLFGDEGSWLRFSLAWGLSSWLVYSCISYKTPWLVINATLPLILALVALLHGISRSGKNIRSAVLVVVLVILVFAGRSVANFVFEKPYGKENPYSYVHTSRGMMELIDQIDSYWEKYPDAKVLIAVHSYWPLPYYLRKNANGKVAYLQSPEPMKFKDQYDIIIAEREYLVNEEGWARRYFRLSDVQESQTYFKRRG